MAVALAHRGPDDHASHAEGPVALAHRRLSIIDLSASGRQPMSNEDGTVWLVFNGEIYNFRDLRRRLGDHHKFRGTSDSEVILHLYEDLGTEAIAALDGMFALALWDARRRELVLARDRSGKKPLFYFAGDGFLAFASEVKALLRHPGVPHTPDAAALPLYLTHGYVPTPGTFYTGIRSLPPAHLMVVSETARTEPTQYWRVRFRNERALDPREAEERFRVLLRGAVERRLISDVPLGAFLSGGLDSSSIVAMMAPATRGRVKTFTIGFRGSFDYDERAHARLIAEHFGTDHTEFVVEPRAIDLIDRLVWHHDGPFGDASAIPTYLLCELTRRHVTVALNGDGGDEVFAGYLRFYSGLLSERIPRPLFALASRLSSLLPEPRDRRHVFRLVKRFAEAGALGLPERYLRWNSYFTTGLPSLLRPELHGLAQPETLLRGYRSLLAEEDLADRNQSTLTRLLQLNFETYLPGDLNVKMDRMSMAHALEARSPFLDTEIVEFGAALPDQQRMSLGRGKMLLRRAMRGLLPDRILRQGKRGFGPPLGAWFRGELDNFLSDRLLQRSSPIYDYLIPETVARLIAAHRSGAADLSPQIWSLLTLESWLRQERAW